MSHWSSFLTERTQQIANISIQHVLFGVPQGSVLGPLLYVLYIAELFHVVAHQGLRLHMYADDCQVSLERQPPSISFLLALLASTTGWRQADYYWTHPRLRSRGWVQVNSWTRSTVNSRNGRRHSSWPWRHPWQSAVVCRWTHMLLLSAGAATSN